MFYTYISMYMCVTERANFTERVYTITLYFYIVFNEDTSLCLYVYVNAEV